MENRKRPSLTADHYDVFLAHSFKDQYAVEQTLQMLEERGLNCCYSRRDFLPGYSTIACIEDAVLAARFTLVFVSREFLTSPWCQRERQIAEEKAAETSDVVVIPILVDVHKKELPISFKALTYVEMADPGAFIKLCLRLGVPDLPLRPTYKQLEDQITELKTEVRYLSDNAQHHQRLYDTLQCRLQDSNMMVKRLQRELHNLRKVIKQLSNPHHTPKLTDKPKIQKNESESDVANVEEMSQPKEQRVPCGTYEQVSCEVEINTPNFFFAPYQQMDRTNVDALLAAFMNAKHLGDKAMEENQSAIAVQFYGKAREMQQKIPDMIEKRDTCNLLISLGIACVETEWYPAALDSFSTAICQLERDHVYGKRSSSQKISACHHYCALVLKRIKRPHQALQHYEKALAIERNLRGPDTREIVAHTLLCLGENYLEVNKEEEGQVVLQEACQIERSLHRRSHSHIKRVAKVLSVSSNRRANRKM
ncbi:uncharacterized protein LOC106175270 [Lingula anatina]|uniref:Uncharacterized protein LOC106175270 n=1 Tax=Lingula anatina TaxID=7574 RepID=A0A1S3JQK5_LINAN|nr:uncharacterized protein LOC106175270 [Lingula anatina]|eukprot:XP_013412637.1 uncharacterized protein LOC106175270 [Lingula anatina]